MEIKPLLKTINMIIIILINKGFITYVIIALFGGEENEYEYLLGDCNSCVRSA